MTTLTLTLTTQQLQDICDALRTKASFDGGARSTLYAITDQVSCGRQSSGRPVDHVSSDVSTK